eukprot:TRINITY_DN7724_c0_g1_i1.p1 TRINITY_DN7724_c0_g1~~TRINITY_DN7724_c0_g1_i1.p1  ORF type:complete len:69 (-),score=15.83 TRINITY_DN7724_c0_g1_i1:16-222(-)
MPLPKGGIYNNLKKIEESLKELNQSGKFQQANANAACFHGDVFGSAGRFSEAVDKYKKCAARLEERNK